MKEYNRTTRKCSFSEIQEELAAAIATHVDKFELGDLVAKAILCCETRSERANTGLLKKVFGDPNRVRFTAVLLTPDYLVWATTDTKLGAQVCSAKLNDIEITEFRSALVEDRGVQIFGFLTGAPKKTQAFIGLGLDDAGVETQRTLLGVRPKQT